jgi:hypothetical protein
MKQVTPKAKVILYNYKDRAGSDDGASLLGAGFLSGDAKAMPITEDIVSISTSKSKSQPAGNFEIVLSPRFNWTSFVSPGSWLSIHMSPDGLKGGEDYSYKNLKMIGRVDSVRTSVAVNQSTGARQTSYTVVGRDWGQVFESYIYIDQAIRVGADDPLAQIMSLFATVGVKNVMSKGVPSSTDWMRQIIDVWGRKYAIPDNKDIGISKLRYSPNFNFVLPTPLVSAIGSGSSSGISSIINSISTSNNLADLIGIVPGKLSGYDKYSDFKESLGPPNPEVFVGMHTLWQALHAHACDTVNELVAELRFEGSGGPKFALYKRIRPFALTPGSSNGMSGFLSLGGGKSLISGNNTENIRSSFFNLKRTPIATSDVIALDAGTNWQDRVNFVEVLPNFSYVTEDQGTQSSLLSISKDKTAVLDAKSFAREGLKPLMFNTSALPPGKDGNSISPAGVSEWLPVMREWYFDAHKMLNGSISFIGQAAYIAVGENIMFSSNLLGKSAMTKSEDEGSSIVAHVESIANRFQVDENGARSFVTTVNFVRGVITSSDGSHLLDPDSFGIDSDSTLISTDERLSSNVY